MATLKKKVRPKTSAVPHISYSMQMLLTQNSGVQVHPGLIELDPEDAVIVVNYEVRQDLLKPAFSHSAESGTYLFKTDLRPWCATTDP